MSNPVILMNSRNAISSRESEAGHTPSASPDGQTTDQSGQAVALVSRFRAPGKCAATPTTDISGQLFADLSRSLVLQQSLASRLRARLDLNGSLLFRLTWKHATMLSGLPLLRQRASARGTSGKGSIGSPPAGSWRTPTSSDGNRGAIDVQKKKQIGSAVNLPDQVKSWPTPKASDGEFGTPMTTGRPIEKSTHLATIAKVAGWGTPMESDKGRMPNEDLAKERAEKGIANLSDHARMAAWGTPRSFMGKGFPGRPPEKSRDNLEDHVWGIPTTGRPAAWTTPAAHFRERKGDLVDRMNRGKAMHLDEQVFLPRDGTESSGSIVPTENRGQLNPAFVRHLMGYPPIWDATAPGKARGAKAPRQDPESCEDTETR